MKNLSNEEIENHINSKIEEFKSNVLKLAIKHNHPFIGAILLKSLNNFKESALSKKSDVICDEAKYLL